MGTWQRKPLSKPRVTISAFFPSRRQAAKPSKRAPVSTRPTRVVSSTCASADDDPDTHDVSLLIRHGSADSVTCREVPCPKPRPHHHPASNRVL